MITDDELLLYYYRDGLDAAERVRIGAAISNDPDLARRMHALVARLDAAAAMCEVPVPAHTQQRWQAALARAATDNRVATPARGFFTQPRWQAAAAAVAIVALTLTLQNVMSPSSIQTSETVEASPTGATSAGDTSAYENGLKWHLASTEKQLASLGDATPEERARLVETIIGQNRIYALAAERAGEPQLARVLRAFTPILESVAGGRVESASSVAQLNFELRVMQARLAADAAAPNNTL
jgi:hypothetical protein